MQKHYDEHMYDDEDFEQSGGGKWVRVIGIVLYMIIIIAFAWQTMELVGWLFPGENWFMKAVTVFVCDGCATLYAMTEMFYRFRLRWSKNIIFGMWIITFIFSTSATIVQMYLGSTNRIPHDIDPGVTTIAYGIIILAFVVNIIAITVVIRMEFNAGQPKKVYLDDKEYKQRRLQRVRVVEQAPVMTRALAPAAVAHTRQQIDPHKVKPRVDSEKKSIEKKESALEKFHQGIEKVLFKGDKSDVADGELESPVDYKEDYDDEPLAETQEFEVVQPEKDLMDMSIDDRWQEYSSVEPPSMKGKGGKKAKKAASRADGQES